MPWACVYTYGGCEQKAVDNLRNQGYEAFCPLYRAPDPRDFRTLRTLPLFPTYAFVSLTSDQRWASINSTVGVIRLLTTGPEGADRRPIFLPRHQEVLVDGWRASDRVDRFELPPGTRVRIRVGTFHNFEGIVQDMSKSQRVRVLLSLFNRDTVVEFDSPNDLERME